MKNLFKRSGTPNAFLAYLIPLVIIGLTIADFVPDQKIDKILLGMLLIFGLGALGWKLDDIVGQNAGDVLGSGSPDPAPNNPTNADDKNATNNNG